MRSLFAFLSISIAITLFSGCGDSASEITGTLPVVTGIMVDSIASKGDTIVVTWNALTGTEIEGYLFWIRYDTDDPWMLVDDVTENVAVHLADRSAAYTVMAYNGNDTSFEVGVGDNTRADNLSETSQIPDAGPLGFRVDLDGDSLIVGDPASMDFHQQFIVTFDQHTGNGRIFQGNAHPDQWPGGMRTMLSTAGGFVAPSPEDTISWQDSIPFEGNCFLALETGNYCRLTCLHAAPDSLGETDTLFIDGQLQPLAHVRVFNQTL
jgi:hypothetical protein